MCARARLAASSAFLSAFFFSRSACACCIVQLQEALIISLLVPSSWGLQLSWSLLCRPGTCNAPTHSILRRPYSSPACMSITMSMWTRRDMALVEGLGGRGSAADDQGPGRHSQGVPVAVSMPCSTLASIKMASSSRTSLGVSSHKACGALPQRPATWLRSSCHLFRFSSTEAELSRVGGLGSRRLLFPLLPHVLRRGRPAEQNGL